MRSSTIILLFFVVASGISFLSCSDSSQSTPNALTQSKSSSLLLLQVSLRRQQLASPTPQRLAQMQEQGMDTSNLGVQRVYIYLKQQLTPDQVNELHTLGINVYSNSWVPPAGNNRDGFYLADLPIDKLDALVAKDYVVRLDTAEKLLKPQSDTPVGG